MNIIWFRRDLRLADNQALASAVSAGECLPIYILDEAEETEISGAGKWWLHQSLDQLNKALDGTMHFFKSSAASIIPQVANEINAKAVYWNNCYEPSFVKRDKEIEEILQKSGVNCQRFEGAHLWKPGAIVKGDGTPYKIFGPYLKASIASGPPPEPLSPPHKLQLKKVTLSGEVHLNDLNLLPKIKWFGGMAARWEPGEAAAKKLLNDFVANRLSHYSKERNYPARDILSRLSPYLHYGELSPATLWHAVQSSRSTTADKGKFLSELTWRDFAYSLLYHFPETVTQSYNVRLQKLRWQYNKALLEKWQKGQTGFPIVDAGMRQMWQTGYMHNRVRMITASFLVKNLLMDWRIGAEWFMDCLVDADLAVNTMNWQWVAGTGLDAAPFFRVFNPVLQSKKYDPDGTYIKTYVPELAGLPKSALHEPWKAKATVLKAAGISLGKDYPLPCIDLQTSVKEALKAFEETKF
jgi:deoxyribodipyrimidine photo-lyase